MFLCCVCGGVFVVVWCNTGVVLEWCFVVMFFWWCFCGDVFVVVFLWCGVVLE